MMMMIIIIMPLTLLVIHAQYIHQEALNYKSTEMKHWFLRRQENQGNRGTFAQAPSFLKAMIVLFSSENSNFWLVVVGIYRYLSLVFTKRIVAYKDKSILC